MSTTYRVLSDQLYRSVATVTTANVITEAYDTDAYGNTLCYSGPGTDGEWFTDDDVQTNNPINTTIFTGRQYDPESQIYYYRARYYSPQIGRFLSRDPLANAELSQGPNLYWFIGDNSVNGLDPAGLAPSTTVTPDTVNSNDKNCTIQIVVGHGQGSGDSLDHDFAKRGLNPNSKDRPPAAYCVGYIGCDANYFNRIVPKQNQIPNMPQNVDHGFFGDWWYKQGGPDQLPFALTQSYISQAIAAALALVPTKCKPPLCCKSMEIKVTCLTGAAEYAGDYCSYDKIVPCS
jgi:RHS repeat-associated protein